MEPLTFVTCLQLPRPWPPSSDVELCSLDDKQALTILASRTGQMVARLCETGGSTNTFHFASIDLRGAGPVVLSLVLSCQSARLKINGNEIPPFSESTQVVVIDTTNSVQVEPYVPLYQNIESNFETWTEEWLFIETLADIEARYLSGRPYDLIRSSGMLRQLFLDEAPLTHKVNRKHHVRLQFHSRTYGILPPDMPIDFTFWLSPEVGIGSANTLHLVGLSDFMKSPCAFKNRTAVVTVSDVIKLCAHVLGGIHLGRPNSYPDQVLTDFDAMAKLLGGKPSLATLAGIVRISLTGLFPLAQTIVSHNSRR